MDRFRCFKGNLLELITQGCAVPLPFDHFDQHIEILRGVGMSAAAPVPEDVFRFAVQLPHFPCGDTGLVGIHRACPDVALRLTVKEHTGRHQRFQAVCIKGQLFLAVLICLHTGAEPVRESVDDILQGFAPGFGTIFTQGFTINEVI